MPIHKTEAIVLNKRDFRETSLIVDLYTRDFGKIGGLLKGFRTEPGKFASNLETFSFNEVIFYHKRDSGLHLVTQCDIKDSFDRVRASIDRITAASFMMELINAVMQAEDKNEEVFDLALNCLSELKVSPFPEKILTIFKIKMLTLSGFKPHFDSCISCDERILGQARFSLSLGGLLCEKCQRRDLGSRAIFRGTVATILHIERSEFKVALNLGMNPQIKKELEIILNAFLNFHLERELKSQKVINKMAALAV
ncbi:MAG: DNA repair protein RecO [Candidatus Omnitrophica bacterium]|nr:DNA repair protein RecO [Candidatus Omnitrophota bacterium]